MKIIEKAILEKEGYGEDFFFPYIELHEFEAMIFSDITKLEETYFEYDLTPLSECVKEQSNPELINNGVETAPSKRIINYIQNHRQFANEFRKILKNVHNCLTNTSH